MEQEGDGERGQGTVRGTGGDMVVREGGMVTGTGAGTVVRGGGTVVRRGGMVRGYSGER